MRWSDQGCAGVRLNAHQDFQAPLLEQAGVGAMVVAVVPGVPGRAHPTPDVAPRV
jgi:hypothetical protein